MSTRLAVALSGALLALLAGCGEDSGADVAAKAAPVGEAEVEVTDGWVRATKGTEDPSMTGAFMSIENLSDVQVTLTGGSSDVAGMAEIHQMVMKDGAMVMQPIEGGLEIPAGQTTVLMPGGNHVMLMGLKSGLAPGDEVEVTLEFADGTTEDLTLPVKKFTEEEPHYHDPSEGSHE
jgi:periplasmic copper chaperone A